jgi:hypothetical protein
MSIDTTWHFFNSSHVFSLFFLIICCPMSAVRIFYSCPFIFGFSQVTMNTCLNDTACFLNCILNYNLL